MRVEVQFSPSNIGSAWSQDTMGGTIIHIQLSVDVISTLAWVQEFKEQLQKEANARANNPALASCYNEYQTMLNLVK